jgi:hypothetical protein
MHCITNLLREYTYFIDISFGTLHFILKNQSFCFMKIEDSSRFSSIKSFLVQTKVCFTLCTENDRILQLGKVKIGPRHVTKQVY